MVMFGRRFLPGRVHCRVSVPIMCHSQSMNRPIIQTINVPHQLSTIMGLYVFEMRHVEGSIQNDMVEVVRVTTFSRSMLPNPVDRVWGNK